MASRSSSLGPPACPSCVHRSSKITLVSDLLARICVANTGEKAPLHTQHTRYRLAHAHIRQRRKMVRLLRLDVGCSPTRAVSIADSSPRVPHGATSPSECRTQHFAACIAGDVQARRQCQERQVPWQHSEARQGGAAKGAWAAAAACRTPPPIPTSARFVRVVPAHTASRDWCRGGRRSESAPSCSASSSSWSSAQVRRDLGSPPGIYRFGRPPCSARSGTAGNACQQHQVAEQAAACHMLSKAAAELPAHLFICRV